MLRSGNVTGRALTLICCLCFLLIVVALLLIDQSSPATGYELSIYESLPAAVWICLILSLAGGTGVIVHQAFASQKSKYWLLGFFVIIFAASIILLLPIFRGYPFYGSADTGAHVLWTERVLADPRLMEENRYPITHILMAQLAQVCGASPEVIAQIAPVLFTVVFMLFSYLLASSVMPQKGQALLAAASTALFFNYYHVSVYPQALSIMSLPLVFYLYFKGFGRSSLSFRVAFVIVLMLFPYFHPAPAAVLIASLLAAEGAKVMWRVRRGVISSPPNEPVDRITFEPTLISSVTFLTWISSFGIFRRTIRNTLGWLGGEIESLPRVTEVENLFRAQGLGIQQQVVLALKMYGDNLIYLSLSSIALLMIAWRLLRRQEEVKELSILSLPFLVSGPVWVLIFATTLMVTFGRLMGANIMMWATPVFAAFALHEIFGRWKRAGVIIVTSVVLCASVIGIFGVYHSPYILQASWQHTRQDAQGEKWFRSHTALQFGRSAYANLGIPSMHRGTLPVPESFGYPQQQTVGDSLRYDTLLLLTQRTRLCNTDPTLAKSSLSACASLRVDQRDFERLARDPSVNKVYSNGEFELLFVTAGGGES